VVPLSREEKLHHILAAVAQSGMKGIPRSALETWIENTFRLSGQSTRELVKDLRIRKWVRETGGRYTVTEDGRKELEPWEAERVIAVTVRAPGLPSSR